eukprot:Sspe_Gene.42152::Locus_20452_Transcript_1_1_Confidence_1.000_Length_1484::g.42152::m.42152
MADLASYTGRILALRDGNAKTIKLLAQEAPSYSNAAEVLVDVLQKKVTTQDPKEKLAGWFLIDAMIKSTSFGRTDLAPRIRKIIVNLASMHIPWNDAQSARKYSRMVETWGQLFGEEDVRAILARRDAAGAAPGYGNSENNAQRESYETAERARAVPPTTRPIGAPAIPMARQPPQPRQEMPVPTGKLESWEERTRHNLPPRVGVIPAQPPKQTDLAPPMPIEAPVPVPRPAPGAPSGHVKAPPPDHTANYLRERRANLKEVLRNARMKREREQAEDADDEVNLATEKDPKKIKQFIKRRMTRLIIKSRYVAAKVDESKWPKMPATFPRDPETDVQIGNYIEGVMFIRDAIEQAGGALELSRLSAKIPDVKSLANRIKSVREFIDIHTPTTFVVTREEGRIIVRLSD